MRRIAGLAGAILLSAAGAAPAAASQASDAAVTGLAGRASVSIPVEVYDHQLLAQVRVNGEGPYWFILDTGWTRSAVDKDYAGAMHVAQTGTFEGYGAGGNVTAGEASDQVSFDFGQGFAVSVHGATISSFGGQAALFGHPYQGVIGHNILGRFVLEIDYEKGIVTFHDPKTYRYHGRGTAFPATFWRGYDPQIDAALALRGRAPIITKLTIDTGAGALTLSTPLVKAFDPRAAGERALEIPLDGTGGKSKYVMGRFSALRLGPYRLRRPWAALSQTEEGSFAGASIGINGGGEVLSRFKLIVDYPGKQVILEPNSHIAEPFRWDASGMILGLKGGDLRAFMVLILVPGSPASEAGIQPGDVLDVIDGHRARERTLAEIRALFEEAGRTHEVTVRRGDKTLTMRLKLRELI